MNRTATEPAIIVILKEMRRRLDEAVTIAKAAEACVGAGNFDKAVEIALGIEQLTYEASRLLDSASLLNRLSKNQI
jgi:hypothetical protein